MPWDIANGLRPEQLLGMTVAAGEIRGRVFDWGSLTWKDPS